ncbi:MAG: hypothetical protein K1Y02_00600 [Candidatus Hydrogenedentes bacterium]|nr:hypothetical protein [Candidatus Hydrogenedentota bacterium]
MCVREKSWLEDDCFDREEVMAQTVFYRLFGLGGLSRQRRKDYESEGVVYLDEGIWYSIKFQRFRAPGIWIHWKKKLCAGSVVFTRKRLIILSAFSLLTIVEIPLNNPLDKGLRIEVDGKRVRMEFDAEDFLPRATGHVTVKFSSAEATHLFASLQKEANSKS